MQRFRKSTVAAAGLATVMLLPTAGFAAAEHHEVRGAPSVENGPEPTRLAHMGGGMMGGMMGGGMPGMMAPQQGYPAGPCHYGMAPRMTGPGMMGGMMGPRMTQGMGHGMGPMMGPGMMGQGMGPGMMGQGMPGQGYGAGPGMMAPGQGYGPDAGMMGRGMGPGMMSPGTPGQGMMPPGQGYGMGPGMMTPGYGPQQGYGMGPGADPDQDLSVDDVRARLERSLGWHGNPRLAIGDVTETDEDTISADIVTRDGSLVQRFLVDRHSGAMRMAE